ncbi:FxsA family protein [Chloroflexota bacterium]
MILLFTFVPIIELMLLIRLGVRVGALNAILVVLATGIVGAVLVRWQGLAILSRIRSDLGLGIIPTRELFDGALVLIGGILLLTPGLMTDAIGLGLLIPITRRVVRNWLRAGLRKRVEAGGTGFCGRWHF